MDGWRERRLSAEGAQNAEEENDEGDGRGEEKGEDEAGSSEFEDKDGAGLEDGGLRGRGTDR